MVPASTLLLGLSTVFGVLAAPSTSLASRNARSSIVKRNTPNSSGTNGGFFYQFWSDGNGEITYTNGAGGAYSVNWNGNGDFTAGKGWNPGNARSIAFSGTYSPSSSGSLAVYGWTTDPLVEYYIMESYASSNPAGGLQSKGTVTSDGATYNIYENTRTNAPSIQGTATFQQYISVRQSKRTNGTVTTGNHFDAWKALGMDLGTFNYQIVSTEAWSGSGSSSITVAEG